MLLFLQALVQFPPRRILQDEVNSRNRFGKLASSVDRPALVIEVAKQAENVWVAQMRLDLDLSAKLVFHLKVRI